MLFIIRSLLTPGVENAGMLACNYASTYLELVADSSMLKSQDRHPYEFDDLEFVNQYNELPLSSIIVCTRENGPCLH